MDLMNSQGIFLGLKMRQRRKRVKGGREKYDWINEREKHLKNKLQSCINPCIFTQLLQQKC